MAKISIVVPIYNVEKHLEQCLDSIVNQTYKDIEIILMDDGSTDRCGEIVDKYAQKDKRIKAIHKKNEGYGKTINRAFDMASGEYIGIVESDDYIEPDMYEKLLAQIEKLDADVCKAGFYKYNSTKPEDKQNEKWSFEGQEYDSFPKDRAFHLSEFPEYFAIHASIWTGLYRKSFLEKYNIRMEETEAASYQDFPFITSVLCNAKKIALIPEYMYHWRLENNQNSSTTRNDKKLLIMPKQCKKVKQIAKDTGSYDYLKEALYKHLVNANYVFYNRIDLRYKREYFDLLHEMFEELQYDNSFKFKYFYQKFEKDFAKNIIKNDYVSTINREYKLFKKLQKIKHKKVIFWGAITPEMVKK